MKIGVGATIAHIAKGTTKGQMVPATVRCWYVSNVAVMCIIRPERLRATGSVRTAENGTTNMTDRKNLKIAEDTYDALREEKRDMETWDSMFRRLLRGGGD